MVNNGFIAFISETGGSFDTSGNPVASTKVVSSFFPCNLAVITREYKSYSDGQFKDSKYKIVVDNYLIAGQDLSNLKEVKLKGADLADLGVFQVQNKELLVLVSQTKIVV